MFLSFLAQMDAQKNQINNSSSLTEKDKVNNVLDVNVIFIMFSTKNSQLLIC